MPLRTQTAGGKDEPAKTTKRRASADQGPAAKVAKKNGGGMQRHTQEESGGVPGGKKDWIKDGPVDQRRVRLLTKDVREPKTDGKVVICYLQRDLRVQDNWALLLAQEAARALNRPLHVVHLLVPDLAFKPTKRHLSFFLEAAREVEQELKQLNIGFDMPFVTSKDPKGKLQNALEKIHEVFTNLQPALAITDFNPMRLPTQVVGLLTRVYEEGLSPLYQVDTHGVVPCWVASDKLETAARTIRPKLQKLMGEFTMPFPKVTRHPVSSIEPLYPLDEDMIMRAMKPEPPEALPFWKPGSKAALQQLKMFATPQNLAKYGESRNDPLADVQSDLSPYIHFGNIAIQRCLMEVLKVKESNKSAAVQKGVESFIDEVVVRSSLCENFVFYNPHYDDIKGAPEWAQETLSKHEKDKREPQYEFKDLEEGRTYDDLWNATQLQLVREGKMHGFLRMYWSKKILEWSKSPQEAINTALKLNDKYHLDGRDPNGVCGCMWSIAGVHDHAFKERPILGKIRFMSYQGCERKFDVKAFIRKYPGAASNAVDAVKEGLLPPAGKPKAEVSQAAKDYEKEKQKMLKSAEENARKTQQSSMLPREKKMAANQGKKSRSQGKQEADDEELGQEDAEEYTEEEQ
ncbi:fad binding domain of dna photolyase domain-containing protein [Cystoisospora suis]|uniref:Deoxyribodipyrimidine photo-lyase n=1 Tax=Cystoisospora suis TaxID=483139 RepID=A0A2C6KH53_9APIC|nr:fad binding domain of dna photolyase domain-containing protein [Cystoisospora suis]